MSVFKPTQWAVSYLAALLAALLCPGSASAQINVAVVPVQDAGNAPDGNGRGAVSYSYGIGKFDVTAGQYAAFLNAVATGQDVYHLYDSGMAPGNYAACGITQSVVANGFAYSVSEQSQNLPVNGISWGAAARFCNWLSNGQPTGTEGPGTTETGSYTLSGISGGGAVRNSGAKYALPTANEWYKAAYHDPSIQSYYLYPTRSNAFPNNVLSATRSTTPTTQSTGRQQRRSQQRAFANRHQ